MNKFHFITFILNNFRFKEIMIIERLVNLNVLLSPSWSQSLMCQYSLGTKHHTEKTGSLVLLSILQERYYYYPYLINYPKKSLEIWSSCPWPVS